MTPNHLDVVSAYNNPQKWHSRLANFRRFEDAMLTSGVSLTTVEMAYGGGAFDLPDREGVRRVRVRGSDIIWQKENLIRLGFEAIPDWKYGAWVDGDMLFHQSDWMHQVISALQIHPIVQVSSDLVWLGPKSEFVGHGVSFMTRYFDSRRRQRAGKYWHVPWTLEAHGYPGGAWAYRRNAYEAMRGLLDICILGSGDMHMACALVNMPDLVAEDRDYHVNYRAALKTWASHAQATIRHDVGSVPGMAFHLWHGHLDDRAYSTRGQILIRNKFDPNTDLRRDRIGLLHLSGNKPLLRDDIRSYFAERNEDGTEFRRRPVPATLPISHPHHPPKPWI